MNILVSRLFISDCDNFLIIKYNYFDAAYIVQRVKVVIYIQLLMLIVLFV